MMEKLLYRHFAEPTCIPKFKSKGQWMCLGRQGSGKDEWTRVCQCDGEWPNYCQALHRQHGKGRVLEEVLQKDNEGVSHFFTKIPPSSTREDSTEVFL